MKAIQLIGGAEKVIEFHAFVAFSTLSPIFHNLIYHVAIPLSYPNILA